MEGVGAWRCAFGTVLNGVDFAYAPCKLPGCRQLLGWGSQEAGVRCGEGETGKGERQGFAAGFQLWSLGVRLCQDLEASRMCPRNVHSGREPRVAVHCFPFLPTTLTRLHLWAAGA